MRAQALFPRQAEFRTFRPRNVIVVENCADLVLIRAERDNFSERRKRLFVRHLAAEGFIPDRFERLSARWANGLHGIEWVVEPFVPPIESPGRRTALRGIGWSLLWSSVIWLLLMAVAFWHSR